MSKTQRKNRSEIEFLNGKIRELESENRQLRKRLKKLDRQSNYYQDIVDEVVEDIEIKNICPSCQKGTLTEHDFKYILITKCDNCKYQKTRKQ